MGIIIGEERDIQSQHQWSKGYYGGGGGSEGNTRHQNRLTEGDTTMMALIKARQEEYKEDFGTGESKTHRR
jgi:hypothetical protein